MGIFRTAIIMAVVLAVLTVVEWLAASDIEDGGLRFIVLAIGTVIEAALIAWYFMHVYRLWRSEEVH